MRIIHSDACVAEGAAWLSTQHPVFERIIAESAPLPLRLKPDGFPALLDAIIGQQVSTASANAIWARLVAAGLTERENMANAADDTLREVGLSRQKIKYAKALAQSPLNFDELRHSPTDQVITRLTALPGIGLWTAEIYAMFALGHADTFPAGDLALQESARQAFDLQRRPTDRELRAMAADWSPWRSVAARALWAYYRIIKAREGIR